MGVALILLVMGTAVIISGARGVGRHGVPAIEVDDPTRLREERSSSLRAWLAGTMVFVGGGLVVLGFGRYASLAQTDWVVLLLAAVLLTISTGLDVSSTVLLTSLRPNERIELFSPSTDPAPVWLRRVIAGLGSVAALAGLNKVLGMGWALVVMIVLWLLPSLGARYAHNRRVEPQ